ncbi:MAG: right-handed parallel beta-helix repeat-containing protein [Planctomycetota bacterium]|jgi:parallel beta-helix repeat protein
MKVAPFIACFLLVSTLGFSATIRVPLDYPTIQEAINAASRGDTVLVAAGTYVERIDFLGKAITVKSESGPVQTVIDGNHEGSVVNIEDNEEEDAVLEGFTITKGSSYRGGGIHIYRARSILVNNVVILNEASEEGGGIYCLGPKIDLINNPFLQNTSGYVGGGMYIRSDDPTLEENFILDNSAVRGGGIYCIVCGPESLWTQNSIKNNYASEWGGGVYCSYAHPSITDNTIMANSAAKGGGIFCYSAHPYLTWNVIRENSASSGGGIHLYFLSRPTITGNTILLNTAELGGGICCDNAYPVEVQWPRITGNTITQNTATDKGGGVCTFDSYPTLTNNLIRENSAATGGGMYCEGGTITITNNTFTKNSAVTAGAFFSGVDTDPLLTNCILWGDIASAGPEFWWDPGGLPTVLYSDVEGGFNGTGNIDEDPLFADPAAGDHHLAFGSPCIDQGDDGASKIPEVDFDGDTRIVDSNGDGFGRVDMGMDEFLTLKADRDSIPESTGGAVDFILDAGPGNSGRLYLVLGSISGTMPGEILPGGMVTLPLNFDYFTGVILLYLNTPLFDNFLGLLDVRGQSWARLDATGMIPPGGAGHVMCFSFTMNNPFNFVGNPAFVGIVP